MNADPTTDGGPTTVGDLMANDPVVVRPDATLTAAAQLMDEYDISGLPVVAPTGQVIGVISETDLVRARATEWLWANWAGLKVSHLMSSPPITIVRSASLRSAAIKMEGNHVHRLVVVDDDDPQLPIGVVSTSDVVRALTGGDR